MSPESKAMALAKLKVLYVGVGYPEKWQDDPDLAVNTMDPVGNLRRVADRQYRLTLARLGKPIDNTEWCVAPQWVGAVTLFQQNSHNFTAALLQAPKFDAGASDAMNYGAIGAIIGHEVSHFVDVLGAEYEADGRFRRWWPPEDIARYDASNAALVDQFSTYRPFPDLAIDGKLTLTENIADLGGLAAAFDAYRANLGATLGSRAAGKEFVRQQDRQFFIGYARSWRSKYREDGLRKQLASDHAPERYRIATVRNIDAWYDAFDVQPGQQLYLEPTARVRIW
jgi:predicted metalloendopeptidase